jgi:hypothetical protein
MKKIILIIISLLVIYYLYQNSKDINNTTDTIDTTDKDISNLTDNWINAVTINHDPQEIASLFCNDGNLVGTVSQVKRKGDDIKQYFQYFAKLPGIKVISKQYNISKVTSNVFINTAFIDWDWNGLDKPITTRMSFVFRDKCIFQLHSSALPDLNEKLLKVSNMS